MFYALEGPVQKYPRPRDQRGPRVRELGGGGRPGPRPAAARPRPAADQQQRQGGAGAGPPPGDEGLLLRGPRLPAAAGDLQAQARAEGGVSAGGRGGGGLQAGLLPPGRHFARPGQAVQLRAMLGCRGLIGNLRL